MIIVNKLIFVYSLGILYSIGSSDKGRIVIYNLYMHTKVNAINIFLQRKLRAVQKSVEPNTAPVQQQQSVDEKQEEKPEPVRRDSQTNENVQIEAEAIQNDAFETIESPNTNTNTNINTMSVPDPTFPVEFEDNFEFKPSEETPEVDVQDKPKLTEKELKVLRLQLENAEYLQLKSLLQAKINSEQFEIVKLRSHVALKSKLEGNLQNKEPKDSFTVEEQELRQKLMKENAMLEQKRLNLVNQIFQERVACVQLKIELAMKEIMSKS